MAPLGTTTDRFANVTPRCSVLLRGGHPRAVLLHNEGPDAALIENGPAAFIVLEPGGVAHLPRSIDGFDRSQDTIAITLEDDGYARIRVSDIHPVEV